MLARPSVHPPQQAQWSAIVLAAGRGSRMGDATADRPKCLQELGGRSLLAWQRRSLERAGIGRLLVIGGYQAHLLPGDLERIHHARWAATSMVETLCCASAWLSRSRCVVSYSDIVYHPDHVKALVSATDEDIAITYDELWQPLWSQRFGDPLIDAESFSHREGRVLSIGRRAQDLSEIEGQFMGLVRITPSGWRAIQEVRARLTPEERDRQDFTSLLSMLVARGVRVGAVPVRGRWCEVDSRSDLELYERQLSMADLAHEPWSHDWRDE
jgi:L-glutamine-phosphate cytidylyltransferase